MSARTRVELTWIKGRIERWLRFGRAVDDRFISSSDRVVWVEPGSVFAFIRWAANAYGTTRSRIDILRAPVPGERFMSVPLVTPGGVSLLRLSGWPKVEAALNAIAQVEAVGITPEDACLPQSQVLP